MVLRIGLRNYCVHGGLRAFRFEKKEALSHCSVQLFRLAEKTKHFHTCDVDPCRDPSIGFRLKAVSDLFKIFSAAPTSPANSLNHVDKSVAIWSCSASLTAESRNNSSCPLRRSAAIWAIAASR